MRHAFALLVFSFALFGCTKKLIENDMTKKTIRVAIERLMERPNDDAFIIIEDKRTKKFVQVAGGKGQDLVFDLTTQTLSLEEVTKAKAVLSRFKIQLKEWEVYDQPHGKVVGTQRGFSKNLGTNVDSTAQIVWVVLTEVFELGESFDLSIEEN